MTNQNKKKRRQKPPINRLIAQVMIDIQDELQLLNLELRKSKKIENVHLAKLIIKETKLCLEETAQVIESK